MMSISRLLYSYRRLIIDVHNGNRERCLFKFFAFISRSNENAVVFTCFEVDISCHGDVRNAHRFSPLGTTELYKLDCRAFQKD